MQKTLRTGRKEKVWEPSVDDLWANPQPLHTPSLTPDASPSEALTGAGRREKAEHRLQLAACHTCNLQPLSGGAVGERGAGYFFVFAGSLCLCVCVCVCVCRGQKDVKLFMASQSPLVAENSCDVCSRRQRIMW